MKITVKDIVNAARKNGLPHHQGEYIKFDDNNKPVAACWFGQAARNLNIEPTDLQNTLSNKLREVTGKRGATANIVRMNDYGVEEDVNTYGLETYQPVEYSKVCDFAERYLKPYFDVEIETEYLMTFEQWLSPPGDEKF